MSKLDGERRTEIGERLLTRVEFARARYESLHSETETLRELADACLGNSDGVLTIQRYTSANLKAHDAMTTYQHAIQVLNDFVLRGKIPTDSE